MLDKSEEASQTSSFSTEIRERGEITIPKKLRESFHFKPGQEVDFIPLGDKVLMITPRNLSLQEARNKIQKILTQSGYSLKEVLQTLPEARKDIFEKHYKIPSHHKQK